MMMKTMETERTKYEIEHEYLLRHLQEVHKAMSKEESEDAGERDRKLFDDWNDGKMTDKRVYLKFCIYNDIDERMFSFKSFIQWLHDLGYNEREENLAKKAQLVGLEDQIGGGVE